jgi:hypothetical protein
VNKKGQIAKTITWIVATVIIIVILGITLFVADITWGGSKDVRQTTQVDFLVSQSFFSYLLTEDVYSQIKTEENLNKVNGDLAKDIFEEFYSEEYTVEIWLGIIDGINSEKNDFFGGGPQISQEGVINNRVTRPFITERLKLSGLKRLELSMIKLGVRG